MANIYRTNGTLKGYTKGNSYYHSNGTYGGYDLNPKKVTLFFH